MCPSKTSCRILYENTRTTAEAFLQDTISLRFALRILPCAFVEGICYSMCARVWPARYRIGPICFLARWCKWYINQVLISLGLVLFVLFICNVTVVCVFSSAG